MFNCEDVLAGMVKMAIIDVLSDEERYSVPARAWLREQQLEHLLGHPGAASMTAAARKRPSRGRPRKKQPAAVAPVVTSLKRGMMKGVAQAYGPRAAWH